MFVVKTDSDSKAFKVTVSRTVRLLSCDVLTLETGDAVLTWLGEA